MADPRDEELERLRAELKARSAERLKLGDQPDDATQATHLDSEINRLTAEIRAFDPATRADPELANPSSLTEDLGLVASLGEHTQSARQALENETAAKAEQARIAAARTAQLGAMGPAVRALVEAGKDPELDAGRVQEARAKDNVTDKTVERAQREGCTNPKLLAGLGIGGAVIIAVILVLLNGGGSSSSTTAAAGSSSCSENSARHGALVLIACSAPTSSVAPQTTITSLAATVAAGSDLTGQVDSVTGQSVAGATVNAVHLLINSDGLTGEVHLHATGKQDFGGGQGPTDVCLFIDSTISTPVPDTTAADGSVTVNGPIDAVVGYANVACGGGPPSSTQDRPATLALTVTSGAATGTITLNDGSGTTMQLSAH